MSRLAACVEGLVKAAGLGAMEAATAAALIVEMVTADVERRAKERDKKRRQRGQLGDNAGTLGGHGGDNAGTIEGQTGGQSGDNGSPLHPPPFRSGSDPIPEADPERAIPRAGATKHGKPIPPPEYPEEFEAFWRVIGVGSKAQALKAWGQVGKPAAEALKTAWKLWNEIAWPDGIGVPHTSTWLRSFDWREQPRGKSKGTTGGQPPPRPAPDTCFFHQQSTMAATPSSEFDRFCPVCRRLGPRQKRNGVSEPLALGDIK